MAAPVVAANVDTVFLVTGLDVNFQKDSARYRKGSKRL